MLTFQLVRRAPCHKTSCQKSPVLQQFLQFPIKPVRYEENNLAPVFPFCRYWDGQNATSWSARNQRKSTSAWNRAWRSKEDVSMLSLNALQSRAGGQVWGFLIYQGIKLIYQIHWSVKVFMYDITGENCGQKRCSEWFLLSDGVQTVTWFLRRGEFLSTVVVVAHFFILRTKFEIWIDLTNLEYFFFFLNKMLPLTSFRKKMGRII